MGGCFNLSQEDGLEERIILTESTSHWADDNQINLLSYWQLCLQVLGQLITLWAEAEIGERGIVEMVVLWVQSAIMDFHGGLGDV